MTGATLEIAIMAGLALVSVTCVTVGLRSLGGEMRLVRRMDDLKGTNERRFLSHAVATLGSILISDTRDRQEVERNLHIAGYYHPAAPLIFAWVRLGATACAWIAAAVAIVLMGKWHGAGPYLPWGAAGIAYILSKRVLGWSAARRRRKVEAELPFTLDVFLMMLESGVSLDQSFRTFVQLEGRAAPIMTLAIAALIEDLDRGMPHETALDRWAARLGVAGARELAGLFKRNLAHGSELGAALASVAKDFTDKRVAGARETAGRKSAQITVVMVLFFMPALFIILAGPAFVTLLRTLSGIGR